MASLVNAPCLGQVEAALAESARWGRGRERGGGTGSLFEPCYLKADLVNLLEIVGNLVL